MDIPIRNISDLRGEIYRLKELTKEQNTALGERFKNPVALFSTVKSLFSKRVDPDSKSSSFFDQDLVGLISRFVLPFTLNKTIFRHSGFIVKTIVGLVSQKASHFITEDSVTSVWDKVSSFFKGKAKNDKAVHKGVTPLSETY